METGSSVEDSDVHWCLGWLIALVLAYRRQGMSSFLSHSKMSTRGSNRLRFVHICRLPRLSVMQDICHQSQTSFLLSL